MPSTFEPSELLERVDGDMEFLNDTVAMLAGDGPMLIAAIRESAASGDAAGVARSAHALKGMISNFCAPPSHAAAAVVEQIGRGGDLSALPESLATLQANLDALTAELTEFVAERAGR